MSSHRDPMGYYACLEVPLNATQETIKAAYRRRAKQLHPDHNPSPNAQQEFQQLSEAYHVLSDSRKRRIYDVRAQGAQGAQGGHRPQRSHAAQGARTAQADPYAGTTRRAGPRASGGGAGGQGSGTAGGAGGSASAFSGGRAEGTGPEGAAEPTNRSRAQNAYRQAATASGQATSMRGTNAHGGQRSNGPFDPPEPCQCCGKLAAQPRYVVFPTVRGRGLKVLRSTVEGVFCRTCADNTALRVVWKNWLLGWWAIPMGPIFTLGALMSCARGGFMPRDRNFALLLRQARAFLMRNQHALAHGLAVQAHGYADSPQEKSLAEGLLRAAPAVRGLKLKNKWVGLSWPRAGQVVPPVLLLLLLIGGGQKMSSLPMWDQDPIGLDGGPLDIRPPEALRNLLEEGMDRPTLLRTGWVYEVTAPSLPLRTGPGTGYRIQAQLIIGSLVVVTENAPEGGWVRVQTYEGLVGFVAGRYLTPGPPGEGLGDGFEGNGNGVGGAPSGGNTLTPPSGGRTFQVPPPGNGTGNSSARPVPPSSPYGAPPSSARGAPARGAASLQDASSPAANGSGQGRPPPLNPAIGIFATPPRTE